MMTIERYTHSLKEIWDKFVRDSRNGTFLHLRDYMDYHSDRFTDFSLIARDDKSRILAVLPANLSGKTLCSHSGLTYGGWLMSPRVTVNDMTAIWNSLLPWLRSEGIDELIYKPVPHIFHKYPAEEDLYVLWRCGGEIASCQASTTIDLAHPYGFDMSARRKVRRAVDLGISVSEDDDWQGYWNVLDSCLQERHGASPVHTLEEIKLLKSRFPEQIKLYTARLNGEIIAGTVMYVTETVAHSQYIASTAKGRELNALPLLFHVLIGKYAQTVRYFDFGISTEDGGRYLNEGLAQQKNSFGGRTVVFNSYRLKL